MIRKTVLFSSNIGDTTNPVVDNITALGLITPDSVIGIAGTVSNDSARAGSIGELLESTGTSVDMVTATSKNITSLTLTPGDWDIYGNLAYIPQVGSALTGIMSGIGLTPQSIIYPYQSMTYATLTSGQPFASPVPFQTMKVTQDTIIHLIAYATFTGSEVKCTGNIIARRAR